MGLPALPARQALPAGQDHPLRRSLIDELHLRRFPPFAAPAQMMQFVMVIGVEDSALSRRHAEALCAHYGVTVSAEGRYLSCALPDFHFVWEQHTEYCSYTLIAPRGVAEPFPLPFLQGVPVQWLQSLPGRTLRATQIALLGRDSPAPDEAFLARWFSLDELVCCDVQQGEARIWSNFRVHDDGLGRLLVRDQGLASAGDTARLLQRLQELGNYRNAALLGLSVAQESAPSLGRLERQLTDITRDIAGGECTDDELQQRLSTMSADLARLAAETGFRMGATRAYAQLVTDRLQALQVRRVPGYQTLSDFTERRLVPAVRTCESFVRRLEDLSTRVSWATSMTRTRIETSLERQSRDLLESMNQRASAQLRLQETVEGLSVVAVSYYACGLAGYLLKPLADVIPGLSATWLAAATAPVVVVLTWYALRRLRH